MVNQPPAIGAKAEVRFDERESAIQAIIMQRGLPSPPVDLAAACSTSE